MIEVKDAPVPGPRRAGDGRRPVSGSSQLPVRPRRSSSVDMTVTIRRVLCVLPLLLVAVVAVQQREVLAEGLALVTTARWPWLLAAAGLTCLTWPAAACTRQGAVLERLPGRRLVATQFAAGAANHLLPTGLGASAVNLRFMTVCGLSTARSSAALALYLLAESVGRVGLLAALLVAFPDALPFGSLLPDEAPAGPLLVAGAALVLVVGGLAAVPRVRTVVAGFLRTALREARSVHARPARAVALWGGALAFPALQAGVLVLVARAFGLAVPSAHLAVAYLAATVAVALVPTPGGIGSVEAALVVALVAVGGAAAVATAVVLVFRLITVWLPLLPGAVTLAALVRLKVI